ncbi:MAG: hypothetical protein CBD51_000150 [Flavobacteriales bacterium TMED191]|nr:MAG: hypothetical protein CBD51_000150 [Flavobacteriales bacterium TMED191]|tara:strand:- start:994 stop:1503 length:510 start_codon:yes stop_codon:yes gene_type:complete
MTHKNNLLIIFFILLGVLTRIIPHPPNMTAIGAIALFSGTFLYDKRLAFILPTTILLISDFLLGYQPVLSVYLSFIIIVSLGFILSKKQTFFRVINMSLIASILFFIITNFAVFLTSSFYPKTIIGLLECFTLAIPFFLNTLTGNIVYSLIMFYSFKFVQKNIILQPNS